VKFVDTNIFIRYLTQDDLDKSNACRDFFESIENEVETATTCEAVISEVVYVLSSRVTYRLSRQDIRLRLEPILRIPGFRLPARGVFLRALDLFVDYPRLDFEDALCVAHMERIDIQEIASYDRGFDRVPDLARFEPPSAIRNEPTDEPRS
jgi:predicted nucleic acid-binding protein